MATATATPPVGKTTTERNDWAFGIHTKTDEKTGKVIKEAVVLTEEKATELGSAFVGNIVTVSVDYPSTWDGLLELANTPVNDEDGKPRSQNEVKAELLKLFVNGAKNKVTNRMKARLTAMDKDGNITFKDSDAPEGILDLTSEITSGSKRVFLSEEQKMWRSLEMLPAASKEVVWRAYLSSINKEYYTPTE